MGKIRLIIQENKKAFDKIDDFGLARLFSDLSQDTETIKKGFGTDEIGYPSVIPRFHKKAGQIIFEITHDNLEEGHLDVIASYQFPQIAKMKNPAASYGVSIGGGLKITSVAYLRAVFCKTFPALLHTSLSWFHHHAYLLC